MVMNTGAFSEDLWPGIMKWFGDQYENYQPLWEKMVTKHDSDKQFEKFQGITNYGLAGVKDQGAGIPYRDKYQGFPKEIINVAYGIGTTITYEMMRYDQYDKFRRLPQQLAESVRKTEETVVANLLNNATTTTTTADGLSLLNASHLLVANSATQRNTPATQADFSQTLVEQMYIDVANFVDDQNLPIVVQPTTVIAHPSNQHIIRKVLETEYEVGTGNNTINPVSSARMPLQIVLNPYLTDTDATYFKTNVEDGLVFTEVDPVMLDRDNDFDTKNLKFSAMRLFGVGAVNYLGYYGTTGA